MVAKSKSVESINKYLKSEKRSVAWLSEAAKIPYNTLYFILTRKERTLTDKNKSKINSILKTKF